MRSYQVFLLPVLIAAAGCGGPSSPLPAADPVPDPVPVPCDTSGLAAVDLSGQCRAKPQATMGALEAVSRASGVIDQV